MAREFAATAHADVRPVSEVRDDEMILDIGPDTAERFAQAARRMPARSSGTARSACSSSTSSAKARRAIANAIARSKAFSLAGGGDTLAAIEKYGVEDGISYISTGGGAFLEFVEGKTLPAGRHDCESTRWKRCSEPCSEPAVRAFAIPNRQRSASTDRHDDAYQNCRDPRSCHRRALRCSRNDASKGWTSRASMPRTARATTSAAGSP